MATSPKPTRKSRSGKQLAARQKVQEKVQAHRDRLRAQGLRPVQIWVPDTRAAGFAAAARRQSRRIAASEHAAMDQAFVDAISIGLDE